MDNFHKLSRLQLDLIKKTYGVKKNKNTISLTLCNYIKTKLQDTALTSTSFILYIFH